MVLFCVNSCVYVCVCVCGVTVRSSIVVVISGVSAQLLWWSLCLKTPILVISCHPAPAISLFLSPSLYLSFFLSLSLYLSLSSFACVRSGSPSLVHLNRWPCAAALSDSQP